MKVYKGPMVEFGLEVRKNPSLGCLPVCMASWLLGGCGPEVGLVINTPNDMKIERRTLGAPGVNILSAFPLL